MKLRLLAALAVGTAFLCTQASAADVITITVKHSSGDKTFTATTLGSLPIPLEDAMKGASIPFTVSWFPNVPGYAAMIIDGDPETTTGTFGTPFWWACINEFSAAAGLQTLVKNGDKVEWSLQNQGKCARD